MSNASLARRDLAVLWHPCTQMSDHEWLPLVPIRRGDGVFLEDFDGNRYLDAISSWWVNLFGHNHPRISAAVKAQVDTLEHVLLAGFSHEPAIALAEALLAAAPPGFARVFYADNGSSAMEVALKMSFHYWRNAGRTGRHRFVAVSGAYHGETLGALHVSDVPLYRETYAPLLREPLLAPSPDARQAQPGESARDVATRAADALDALLAAHADEVCAVVLEPLVQCAAGMVMHDPEYVRRVRAACDRHDVHFIADEIAVGFGRTGTLFACEQAQVSPDFLCLSKGISGGYLPLAAVLTTARVYDAFYADYASLRAFLHSHSYTGNPLACSAALATLSLFREEPVMERNAELAKVLNERLTSLSDLPHVANIRQTGMIAALDLVSDRATRAPYPWQERRGLAVYQHALSAGVLLRPLGNTVYFMPPYVITAEQIAMMMSVARDGITLATA